MSPSMYDYALQLAPVIRNYATQLQASGAFRVPPTSFVNHALALTPSITHYASQVAAQPAYMHTVNNGDTLWRIAQRNATTVQAIGAANPWLYGRNGGALHGLDYIRPNDHIVVPTGNPNPTAATVAQTTQASRLWSLRTPISHAGSVVASTAQNAPSRLWSLPTSFDRPPANFGSSSRRLPWGTTAAATSPRAALPSAGQNEGALAAARLSALARSAASASVTRPPSAAMTFGTLPGRYPFTPNLPPGSFGPSDAVINRVKVGSIRRSATDDVDSIAQAFESDGLLDDGGAAARLTSILDVTEHALVPGLQTGGVPFEGKGLRREFQDPDPNNNQIGHFLTAVGLGFKPQKLEEKVLFWDRLRDRVGAPADMTSEEVAIRLIIGHEQAPDPWPAAMIAGGLIGTYTGINQFRTQFSKATAADVAAFRAADAALGNGPNVNLQAADKILSRISVGTGRGNSREDLRLTLVGWHLGRQVASGELKTGAEVATWIRANLGK